MRICKTDSIARGLAVADSQNAAPLAAGAAEAEPDV